MALVGTTDPNQSEAHFEIEGERTLPLRITVGFLSLAGLTLLGGTLFLYLVIGSVSAGDSLVVAAFWLLSVLLGLTMIWATRFRSYLSVRSDALYYRSDLSGVREIPWPNIIRLSMSRRIRGATTYPVLIVMTHGATGEIAIKLRGVQIAPEALANGIRPFLPDGLDLQERF
jgi:hypothetical protein